MSRTVRNRHCTPHGWIVRENGDVLPVHMPTKAEFRQFLREAVATSRHGQARRPGEYRQLSRPRKFRRNPYSKEKSDERRLYYRAYRARMRDLMRHERWEDVHEFRKSGGWLSW